MRSSGTPGGAGSRQRRPASAARWHGAIASGPHRGRRWWRCPVRSSAPRSDDGSRSTAARSTPTCSVTCPSSSRRRSRWTTRRPPPRSQTRPRSGSGRGRDHRRGGGAAAAAGHGHAEGRLPAAVPVAAAQERGQPRRRRGSQAGRPPAGRGARELRRRGPLHRHGVGPARDPLRAAAGPRHQGVTGVAAARRPRLRACHHRDQDPGADSGQAGGRRRGAQLVAQHGHAGRHLRRAAGRLEPADGMAGQGHLRRRRGLRPGQDAAPADRGHHRRRASPAASTPCSARSCCGRRPTRCA